MANIKSTRVYTVTELTKNIRLMLENVYPEIWVEGEVSNFTASSAGHMYFSLKDETSILNCVLFKGNSSRLTFNLEDGLRVLCCGRISVYDKRGQYQLYVSDVELRGKGALEIAFRQLKERLDKEGLFDKARKRPLPFLPRHIGVVTSSTGAAIRDILKIAKRRFSNIEISIRPVRVQGSEAKHDIVDAIKELNEYNHYIIEREIEEHPIDVIILSRGGGSLEDLWPFNEEIVARAIYASDIPVVSAVGHEIDYTISDYVADLRAPTPSAAAELVIPLKEDLENYITKHKARLAATIKSKMLLSEKSFRNLKESYILRTPMNFFVQRSERLDDLNEEAFSSMTHFLELKEKDLKALEGKLVMLSPLAVLARGYSITFKDGKVVRSSRFLERGDLLQTTFAEGSVTSRVEK